MIKIALEDKDIKNIQENALGQFYSGMKSKEYKRTQTGQLKFFVEKVCENLLKGSFEQRVQQFVDMAREDQDKAVGMIQAYLNYLRERTEQEITNPEYLNPSSVSNKIKPIKKLFEMSGIGITWKQITSRYPEQNNNQKTRAYTRDEIKIMLKHTRHLAIKFTILAMSSGGFRVGSWDGVTWDCIIPIYEVNEKFVKQVKEGQQGTLVCAIIVVYRGSKEEYEGMISTEALDILCEYKKEWIETMGRIPKGNDPLLLSIANKRKVLTTTAIRKQINNIREKSGIITPLTEGNRRHEVPACNGLRRYFNTNYSSSEIKGHTLSILMNKEKLMGHYGMVKTDKNYYHPLLQEIVSDYLQAVPNLVISDEQRMKHELEAQIIRADKIEKVENQNEILTKQVKEMEVMFRRFKMYPHSQ